MEDTHQLTRLALRDGVSAKDVDVAERAVWEIVDAMCQSGIHPAAAIAGLGSALSIILAAVPRHRRAQFWLDFDAALCADRDGDARDIDAESLVITDGPKEPQ